MLIIHFPLFWRLRVDRLKRSLDQCGRKSFYAFTKRKRIRVDGALHVDYHLRGRDMCDTAEVSDEFHVLFKCPALKDLQETYIPD